MCNELKRIVILSLLCCFIQFSFLLIAAPETFAGQCPDSMVSYWHLDDATQPYQDSLSSNSGNCAGVCPTPVTGIIGGGQFFNGTDAGINVGTTTSFNWNKDDSFSIEFWLQRNTVGFTSREVIVGRDDTASGSLQWWAGINSEGKAAFSLIDQSGSGPAQSIVGNTMLLDGKWHHVAVVRDGASNKTRLYVDGVLDTTAQVYSYSTGFQSTTAPLTIGWLQNGSYHYGGNLDELAVYSGVLTDFEIWQHATDGPQGLGLGYCYDGTPIRVMPLGDSITKGTSPIITDPNYIVGYRQKLFRTLQNFGYSVDFVGGEQAGSLSLPMDPDHEGHPIWTAAQVANNVYSWLVAHPADIILLHIGTNNVTNTKVSDVEFLLNEIDRYSEDIVVLLARIINRQTLSTATTTFNDNVEAMAMTRIANGDKIIIVDQESALSYPNDIADDNLHPTETGYEKMAASWFAALEGVLPSANALPVLTFSSDLKKFKTTLGQFPQAQSVTLDTFDGIPASGFSIISDASWLDINVDRNTTPTTVTFSVNDNTLPVGLYSAYVTASLPGYVDAVLRVTHIVTTANSNYQLLESSFPDRSAAQLLQGADLAGDSYVFTSPDTDVYRVTFYIDHVLYRVEGFPPYDFSGGSPFNMMQLSGGEHAITAKIQRTTGQIEVISSTFTVSGPLPSLAFSTGTSVFTSDEGSLPTEQIVTLGTSDSTVTDFTLVTDVDWLTLSPLTGATPASVTVSVNDSNLAPGVYSATITAVADGYINDTIAVSYTVTSVGGSTYSLLLSTSSNRSGAVNLNGKTVSGDIYVFTGPDDGVRRVTFSLDGTVVQMEGLAPYDFAGTAVSGAYPYSTTRLSDGLHEISASILLTNGTTEVIRSTFTVNNNIPALTVNTGSMVFAAQQGQLPGEQVMNIGTSDGLATNFTVSTSDGWLTLSPLNGTTPGTVTVAVNDPNLAPGVYNATITAVASGYVKATVTVSYTVTSVGGSTYNLLFSTSSNRSSAVNLDGKTVSGDIYVFTGPDDGVRKVTFSLDGTVVQTEGLAPYDFAGTAVNEAIPYDTTQLADGLHEIRASILLTDGSSEVISSTFTVDNQILALTVDTGSIFFDALQGQLPAEQVITIGTSDGLATNFTVSSTAGWLTLSPPNGTTPGTVTVTVNDPNLAPGVYNATITAVASGYVNATVTVRYAVSSIGGSTYNLLLSSSSDRSNAVALYGATVFGNIYVFTGPDAGVSVVTFSLDGKEVKTERLAPFDFAGTAANGAIPYNTDQLTNGQHVITASIDLSDGSSELISSVFTVSN